MRLRERLAMLPAPAASRLSDAAPPPDPGAFARSERIARLRALVADVERREIARPVSKPAPSAGLRALLGEPVPTAEGPLHRAERWLSPEHQHGRAVVSGALRADPAVLAQLALQPELATLDLSRLLVLDTETTGLAGGTGTVPFLLGLAWFEDGALKLEQLLLPNFGAERPLLLRLAERLAAASCIVTYNGKSFDWPLLRTRFILNRVPCPAPPPHVDLLHCARRVFKRRLPTLRLIELERSVLHFHRDDDIDGAEIPGRYLSYLRGGDPQQLAPVIEHNQHDIIALPAILWRLCAHFERLRPDDDARDQLSYARLWLRTGDVERARVFGESAAECAESAELRCDALTLCALVAKRQGAAGAAAEFGRRALELAGCDLSRARLHLMLTRLYERQLKDVQRAHEHAGFTALAEGERARDQRVQRLTRRLS